MNWQYVAVYVILGLTVLLILIRGVRRYKKYKKDGRICDGCASSSDCALKELRKGNQTSCNEHTNRG